MVKISIWIFYFNVKLKSNSDKASPLFQAILNWKGISDDTTQTSANLA
jgi:hypothetical protein